MRFEGRSRGRPGLGAGVLPILLTVIAVAGCGEPPSDAPLPDRASTVPALGAVSEEAPSPVDAPAPEAGPTSGEGTVPEESAAAPPSGEGANREAVVPVARPDHVRGIYLNAWASGSPRRSAALIEKALRTELNTFVIDVKDASGYVSYTTDVPLAAEVGADTDLRIRNIRSLLERLREAEIYPVARIVVFKDPLLSGERPDLAVQDEEGGAWIDGAGHAWVNPYHEDVWAYNIALAREAAEAGFAEVQWDYVRFPDRPASEMESAVFPGSERLTRSAAIRAFLERARDELSDLDVVLSADVFGVTTTFRHDVGIGQVWEDVVDVVDAVLPMVYPSHYWKGSYGFDEPNAYPYEVVSRALKDAVDRSREVPGAGDLIPWLQDFTLGSPRYGPAEVRAQIQAAHDLGVESWILWNASSRYTEEALLPSGEGDPPDLMIRIGGQVVPTSMRSEPPAPPVGVGSDPLPETRPGGR